MIRAPRYPNSPGPESLLRLPREKIAPAINGPNKYETTKNQGLDIFHNVFILE